MKGFKGVPQETIYTLIWKTHMCLNSFNLMNHLSPIQKTFSMNMKSEL